MQPVAISGAESGAFTYDGLFKRVKQSINGETIYSVYGAGGKLLYRDNASSGEQTDYIRLGSMLVAETTNGAVTYLYSDHLGTPIQGAKTEFVTWSERYTPFGEKWASSSQTADKVGFTGHITDTDTGLTYMQARYYDPVIGRFLSVDPVGFASGGPAYFNRYVYTANDPVNHIDPDGRLRVRGAIFLGTRALRVIRAGIRAFGSGSKAGQGPSPQDIVRGMQMAQTIVNGAQAVIDAATASTAGSIGKDGNYTTAGGNKIRKHGKLNGKEYAEQKGWSDQQVDDLLDGGAEESYPTEKGDHRTGEGATAHVDGAGQFGVTNESGEVIQLKDRENDRQELPKRKEDP